MKHTASNKQKSTQPGTFTQDKLAKIQSTTFNGLTIHYYNSKEYHMIKREVWNQEVYKTAVLHEAPIIIDIGAHIGLSALYFKKHYPQARIYALEPNPFLFELLKQNLVTNYPGDTDLIPLPFAVGTTDGPQDFYIDDTTQNWFSTGGFNPQAWTGTQQTSKISAQTITLATLLREIPDPEIDLLKIDVEGAESSILKRSANALRKVKRIILEYHPIHTKSPRKIIDLLNSAGFAETKVTNIETNGLCTIEAWRK